MCVEYLSVALVFTFIEQIEATSLEELQKIALVYGLLHDVVHARTDPLFRNHGRVVRRDTAEERHLDVISLHDDALLNDLIPDLSYAGESIHLGHAIVTEDELVGKKIISTQAVFSHS